MRLEDRGTIGRTSQKPLGGIIEPVGRSSFFLRHDSREFSHLRFFGGRDNYHIEIACGLACTKDDHHHASAEKQQIQLLSSRRRKLAQAHQSGEDVFFVKGRHFAVIVSQSPDLAILARGRNSLPFRFE